MSPPPLLLQAVVQHGDGGVEAVRARLEASWRKQQERQPGDGHQLLSRLSEAVDIRSLLARNTEELDYVIHALAGGYVPPEAGGDLLRDGAGVLPTGRNIHALDPYRMPSAAARERGGSVAQSILEQHRAANGGAWPETVAVNLWGLDAIKTKGESVGIVLHMVGARPVLEGGVGGLWAGGGREELAGC